jgi:ParB-like chromosome segregation protein Spo0J
LKRNQLEEVKRVPNKLQVEYVSIDEIKTYENNAKLHPAEQIEQIKESIKEFGFNDPIAIDKDNVIIEGHGRYIACKELGINEVPIIRLNELSDEQKRAYMLVHNKLTMNTDFDIELLNDELENIFDIDMSKFDFEIDTLLDINEETDKTEEEELCEDIEKLDKHYGVPYQRKQVQDS